LKVIASMYGKRLMPGGRGPDSIRHMRWPRVTLY